MTDPAPQPEIQPAESRALRLVSPLTPRALKRRIAQDAAEGRLRLLSQVDLLAPEGLPSLARQSLWLLLISGAGYIALYVAARTVQHAGPLLGTGSPLLRGLVLIAANLASYAAILPLHEAVHAAVILALGGRPRFGLKLPFAAYCTAPDQLFTRNGYLAVALAPLIVLSAAGALIIWLAPDLGACLIFGLAGNASGAVGDLASASHLRRLPSSALIADIESGYAAYTVAQ